MLINLFTSIILIRLEIIIIGNDFIENQITQGVMVMSGGKFAGFVTKTALQAMKTQASNVAHTAAKTGLGAVKKGKGFLDGLEKSLESRVGDAAKKAEESILKQEPKVLAENALADILKKQANKLRDHTTSIIKKNAGAIKTTAIGGALVGVGVGATKSLHHQDSFLETSDVLRSSIDPRWVPDKEATRSMVASTMSDFSEDPDHISNIVLESMMRDHKSRVKNSREAQHLISLEDIAAKNPRQASAIVLAAKALVAEGRNIEEHIDIKRSFANAVDTLTIEFDKILSKVTGSIENQDQNSAGAEKLPGGGIVQAAAGAIMGMGNTELVTAASTVYGVATGSILIPVAGVVSKEVVGRATEVVGNQVLNTITLEQNRDWLKLAEELAKPENDKYLVEDHKQILEKKRAEFDKAMLDKAAKIEAERKKRQPKTNKKDPTAVVPPTHEEDIAARVFESSMNRDTRRRASSKHGIADVIRDAALERAESVMSKAKETQEAISSSGEGKETQEVTPLRGEAKSNRLSALANPVVTEMMQRVQGVQGVQAGESVTNAALFRHLPKTSKEEGRGGGRS